MKITELTWREPVVIDAAASIDAAAELMARQGVGALVVVDHDVPVGVVTDRDIVTRGIASGVPLDGRIDAVMTMGPIGLAPSDDLDDLFALFAQHAIRRVPILQRDRVVGMVSLDDAVVSMANSMASVAKVLTAQILFPHAGDDAPVPAVT
ncbi:MAG: CBS domain-containing protein [Ilumatobacter sp.]|nr:CBS domain-containing protein [Ilumatobacter sp.]